MKHDQTTTTPQVYVACLAAYNEGKLHGKWVDATDADEIHEAIKEVIATSPAFLPEEWAFHDYDGFGNLRLGEYASVENIARIGALIEEHGEPFLAYVQTCDDEEEVTGEDFENAYRGEWSSEEEYAADLVENIGWHNVSPSLYQGKYSDETINVFDELSAYIDWESIAQELFQHGEYSSAPCPGGGVYVFEGN